MRLKRIITAVLSSALMLCGCSLNSAVTDSSVAPLPPTAEGKLEELTCYSYKAGKADAHLIYNSKFAVLIDCGEKGFGKEICDHLDKLGIRTLDMLIVTHFDKDHVGGAAKVLKTVEVREVVQSNCPKDSEEYNNYVAELERLGKQPTVLKNQKSYRFGDAEVTIYPPMRDSYPKDESNNSSLITSVRYGSRSMLFTGDAQDQRILECVTHERHSFDMLKVPYHGHMMQRLGQLIDSVKPSIAVITSSDEIPEDREVTDLLSKAGALIYLTREAPVAVKCDGQNISAAYDNK